jgi:phosphate transport system substrate-binding protein
MKQYRNLVLGTALASALALPALAGEATGAGSTSVFPILSQWAADYGAASGNKINYQSVSSGGGIAQIRSGVVDFAVSDMPVLPVHLDRLGLCQFPLLIDGVVPVVNLEGVQPGQLHFSGPLLADIYLGKVTHWDNPAIQKLNPNVALPHVSITVVYRSDGSGTTFNWVNYLAKVSPAWKAIVGERIAVQWPLGIGSNGISGSRNEGVADLVRQRSGAIGYVEYAYVLQNKMIFGLVQNQAGRFVKPGAESFQAAASSADWSNAKDFYLIMTDAPGEGAYPITATVFVLMPKKPTQPERARVALDLFTWGVKNGQKQAEALDYVPLPQSLVVQIESYWKAQFAM